MTQVLEYLFTHARLCERGFDPSAIEECLDTFQNSEEKVSPPTVSLSLTHSLTERDMHVYTDALNMQKQRR